MGLFPVKVTQRFKNLNGRLLLEIDSSLTLSDKDFRLG